MPDTTGSTSIFAGVGTPDRSWFSTVEQPNPLVEDDLRLIKDLTVQWSAIGIEYTNDDWLNGETQMRSGYFRTYEAMRDAMEGFGISTALEKIRTTARGAQVQFGTDPPEAAKDKTGDPEMAKARLYRDYIKSQLEDIAPDALADTMNLHFRGYEGMAVHREVRGATLNELDGKPLPMPYPVDAITSLQEVPHRFYRFDSTSKKMQVYANLMGGQPFDVATLKARGLMIYDEIETSKPYDQRGLLHLCRNPWTAFTILFRLLIRFCSVYGFPIFDVGFDHTIPGARKEAIKLANKLQMAMKMARPNYMTVNYAPTPAVSASAQVFMDALEFLLRLFDQILCGHSQSSGQQLGTGGRMPAAKADADFTRLMNARLNRSTRIFRRQLLRPMIANAFGDDAAMKHTPTMSATISQDPDYLTESQIVSAFVASRIPIDPSEARKRAGFSDPDPATQFVNQAPAAGAPGTAPGAMSAGEERQQLGAGSSILSLDAMRDQCVKACAVILTEVFHIQESEAIAEIRKRMAPAA